MIYGTTKISFTHTVFIFTDVSDITHVVNFDFPKDLTDYIHRVGRTGRAGKKGNALSFISLQEDGKVCERLVELLRESNQEIPDDLLKGN